MGELIITSGRSLLQAIYVVILLNGVYSWNRTQASLISEQNASTLLTTIQAVTLVKTKTARKDSKIKYSKTKFLTFENKRHTINLAYFYYCSLTYFVTYLVLFYYRLQNVFCFSVNCLIISCTLYLVIILACLAYCSVAEYVIVFV